MPMSWIITLFQRFQGIWADKWLKCMTPDVIEGAKTDWQQALTGIDPSRIRGAIEEARNTLEWPPSIAEFLKLCNKETIAAHKDATAYLQAMRDFQPNRSENSEKAWQEMKKKLF